MLSIKVLWNNFWFAVYQRFGEWSCDKRHFGWLYALALDVAYFMMIDIESDDSSGEEDGDYGIVVECDKCGAMGYACAGEIEETGVWLCPECVE